MCGIDGIFGHPEAANLTYLGLYSLQHRGQEAAGITTFAGREMHVQRQQGLVAESFSVATGPLATSATLPLVVPILAMPSR